MTVEDLLKSHVSDAQEDLAAVKRIWTVLVTVSSDVTRGRLFPRSTEVMAGTGQKLGNIVDRRASVPVQDVLLSRE